ncbi:hypothetical protein JXJ21_16520, partial [candidate division KSB1 bacterium]|nr:hypothetical protein [candidate division KSB1 bacterium]
MTGRMIITILCLSHLLISFNGRWTVAFGAAQASTGESGDLSGFIKQRFPDQNEEGQRMLEKYYLARLAARNSQNAAIQGTENMSQRNSQVRALLEQALGLDAGFERSP